MFSGLMPREGEFFKLFGESADLAVRAAEEFKNLLNDLPRADVHSRKVKDIEHQADEVTHRTIDLLHKTFITPLDRDDIHQLISEMDDVIDFLEDAAQMISLYDVKKVTPEILSLADVCVESVMYVRKAVLGLEDLKNTKEIIQNCVEVNRLENEGDHYLRVGMGKLFREEQDVRELIKMKGIYELLETVTDRCEDVANIIEGIVLEYA